MSCSGFVMLVFATLIGLSSARAVNISNIWMLPEEGFPVFYRYFRDRISWYEADAVCQFHHANLVTADSTSQYDAIRAYLKELDITDNIWIGLSKTSEKSHFTWTNFQPLSGEGHWRESIPITSEPMCVTMDPAADFLWRAMPCGGPEVAAFICELEIPSWATGPHGCLLTELPSLTVLYIPEQSAVELTSDCGLDGTKRIACKGDANREEILKQLTCAISHEDFDEKSTKPPIASSTIYETSSEENSLNGKTTKTWSWTSNTVDIDYGMPTRHRRETEDTLSPVSTKSTTRISATKESYQRKATTSETFTTRATNYDTEITTNSLQHDATLDSSISKSNYQSAGINQTGEGLTTRDTPSEEQTEMFSAAATATAESKITVTAIDETAADYPSAINQGQLFSIIENGTMFDIIELNDSVSEPDSRPTQTVTQAQKNRLKKVSTDIDLTTAKTVKDRGNTLYTKGTTKLEKPTKKYKYTDDFKKSTPKTVLTNSLTSEEKRSEQVITKEVELFPIIKDTSIKLNRTFRKELPQSFEENDPLNEDNKINRPKIINLSINNDLSDPVNEHVEIKLQGQDKDNVTETLFIATSIRKHFNELKEKTKPIISLTQQNSNLTNKDNEDIEMGISSNINQIPHNTLSAVKKHFLPKSLLSEIETTDTTPNYVESGESSISSTSQYPLEAEPEEQPRPNRQRQLTRPQRRSFYPYFFSRVLG